MPARGKPPSCKVDIGIMASASLAIAFGRTDIRRSLRVRGRSPPASKPAVRGSISPAVLIMRGQVNLAGIISASVCMELSVSEQSGSLTGAGYFSISISICWCFTLNISVNIRLFHRQAGRQPDQRSRSCRHANRILLASLEPVAIDPAEVPLPSTADDIAEFVHDYVTMTEGY